MGEYQKGFEVGLAAGMAAAIEDGAKTKSDIYDLILTSLLDDWCNGAYDQDTKESAELHAEKLSNQIMIRLGGLISSSRPDASDFLYDAAAHIERLRAALQSIANKCPATCDMTLAHEMAEEAEAALALTSNTRGTDQ